MIIVAKEKDRVMFCFSYCDIGVLHDSENLVCEENVPIKVLDVENGIIIASNENSLPMASVMYNNELMQYATNKDDIFHKLLPEIKKIGKEFADKDDGLTSSFVIAQGNKIFDIGRKCVMFETDLAVHGRYGGFFKTAMTLSDGKPFEERIAYVADVYERLNGIKAYPLVITDTKTCKQRIIRRKEDLLCR